MIAIIDYGMGNLRSVAKALEKVGHKAIITRNAEEILEAQGMVLPGVGAFKDCMRNLSKYKLIDPIYKFIDDNRPFLGICLGLQLLFTESEEFGRHKGLDIIKGKVVRFPRNNLKVPHMGWNTVRVKRKAPLLKGIEDESYFYFVHSYYVVPEEEDVVATTTNYGIEFTSSIWRDNVFACQFHPEKSQKLGLRILRNFGDLVLKNAN
ncbi:imidazole glycerol phosphate synthase subunit HisH [Candidatus Aerophobetes bacterium]|uniref:Imidazole glycerol phosphate synthase subunit HisH n=1 Tax=Aerophobetes bacterium TaxID=2030807 RepID=A0A662D580_UNCAE|nr:MAG: imidazole glycerol phosphate synthase subunit HisH [Candidatus Aerophobetes bacterium]